MERPWISVPCQNPRASFTRPACFLYRVATTAEATIVITSRTIQRRVVPRGPRTASPADASAHSWGEDTEADTLCQKSDVAIAIADLNQYSGKMCIPLSSETHNVKEAKRNDMRTTPG